MENFIMTREFYQRYLLKHQLHLKPSTQQTNTRSRFQKKYIKSRDASVGCMLSWKTPDC
jgi:hypothetical protein